MTNYDDVSDRTLIFYDALDVPKEDKEYGANHPYTEVQTVEEANLIISKCKDGKHAPVLDFDFPIQVYPSSQLGHYHLYLGKKISWTFYKKLLQTLGACELIEPGYAHASMSKGYSAVRPVGVVKTNAPTGVDVLIENAKLRQENYKLRKERDHLLSLIKVHYDEQP